MGLSRPGEEFGVVLAGGEERMPFQFDQLHQASIRGRAAHHISGFQEKIAIGVVEFVAVAVAFIDHLVSVEPLGEGSRRNPAGVDPQAHRAAQVNHVLLFRQQVNHGMGRVFV